MKYDNKTPEELRELEKQGKIAGLRIDAHGGVSYAVIG